MAEAGLKRLQKILAAKPWLITVALAGLLVVIAGAAVLGTVFFPPREPEIQILEPTPSPETNEPVFIDVGGAVENPGLYQFSFDSRINDALVAAGGLAAEADRDWVSANLNLAAKLIDGQKIYIPFKDQKRSDLVDSQPGPTLVNINTASSAELDTLWGVGPATAQKIIDSRPYSKIEDLLDNKVVKSNVYEAIKDKITVL